MHKVCHRGHAKIQSPKGAWRCPTCDIANANKRDAAHREAVGRPKRVVQSIDIDELCIRGHKKQRRPSGRITCSRCVNAGKRAVRAFVETCACPHARDEGFAYLLNNDLEVVCLDCVAQQYARVA